MYSKHFRCLPSLPVEINKEDVLTRLQRRLFSRSERAGMGKGIEASWQRLCYCNVSIELVLYMFFFLSRLSDNTPTGYFLCAEPEFSFRNSSRLRCSGIHRFVDVYSNSLIRMNARSQDIDLDAP